MRVGQHEGVPTPLRSTDSGLITMLFCPRSNGKIAGLKLSEDNFAQTFYQKYLLSGKTIT